MDLIVWLVISNSNTFQTRMTHIYSNSKHKVARTDKNFSGSNWTKIIWMTGVLSLWFHLGNKSIILPVTSVRIPHLIAFCSQHGGNSTKFQKGLISNSS